MSTRTPAWLSLCAAALTVTVMTVPPAEAGRARPHPVGVRVAGPLTTVTDALVGARGVDALGGGRTLVSEADGSFSLVTERRHRPATVRRLGAVPASGTGQAPAVAAGRHGSVWVLTGGGAPGEPIPAGGATLYRWRPGAAAPRVVADIGAYQATDPDPDDLEGIPADSNPFGLAALHDGSVLVSDAAGNDLLHVTASGDVETVARIKPRVVETPEGLPPGSPPAGTPIPSEGVATSVTVGKDGYWYLGELRGFPATPGTSQVWRIAPGTTDAVCDPAAPSTGDCRRYADGLTSIVDLGAGKHGIYAVTLSLKSWLAVELGTPGAETGGLFKINRRHRVSELARGRLVLPGGVDVVRNRAYLTGPVFGPGALTRLKD